MRLDVAEDNGAVIKALAKGRSSKPRHVARTHRFKLDSCLDFFRQSEIVARYAWTGYQILDLGTKAITKGEAWHRLVTPMGTKSLAGIEHTEQTEITKNKEGKSQQAQVILPFGRGI